VALHRAGRDGEVRGGVAARRPPAAPARLHDVVPLARAGRVAAAALDDGLGLGGLVLAFGPARARRHRPHRLRLHARHPGQVGDGHLRARALLPRTLCPACAAAPWSCLRGCAVHAPGGLIYCARAAASARARAAARPPGRAPRRDAPSFCLSRCAAVRQSRHGRPAPPAQPLCQALVLPGGSIPTQHCAGRACSMCELTPGMPAAPGGRFCSCACATGCGH